jgi:hypothetical protein
MDVRGRDGWMVSVQGKGVKMTASPELMNLLTAGDHLLSLLFGRAGAVIPGASIFSPAASIGCPSRSIALSYFFKQLLYTFLFF